MVSFAVITLALPLVQEHIPVLHGLRFDYLLMPPKFVCEGRAKSLDWSLDGRYLVINRTEYADAKRLEMAVIDSISKAKPPVSIDDFTDQRNSVAVWDNEKELLSEIWSGAIGNNTCQEVAITDKFVYLLTFGPKDTSKLVVNQIGIPRTKILREDQAKDEMMILAKDADGNQIVYGDLKSHKYYLASGDLIRSISNLDKLPAKLRSQILSQSEAKERKPVSIDWRSDPVVVKYVYGVSRPVDIIFQYTEDSHGGNAKGAIGVLSSGKSNTIARGLIGPHATASDSTAVAYPLDGVVVVRNLVAMPRAWHK